MNIVIADPLGIPAEALAEFAALLRAAGHAVTAYDTRARDGAELAARLAEAEAAVITNTPLPAAVLDACPCLRYIDVAFTGVDHVDIEACRARGIAVSNAAGYSDQAVAELTLGAIIALLRRLSDCDAAVRGLRSSAGLRGGEIAGRTAGIIGLGRIGLRTARLLLAFGARVIACSPHSRPEAEALGISYVPLEDLLAESDIVTLHAPSTPATRGMLGREQFARMKPGAVFINCARGALVDSAALAEALNTGHIAGAAVDVFSAEPPLPPDEPLLHAKNILLTPHIGFDTRESMQRRAVIVFDNLNAWLAGEPRNIV